MKKLIAVLVFTALVLGMAAPALAQGTQMQAQKNIVQTAVDAGSFKTLATAVKAAGLDGALSTGGPYTVFAPTDDAFKKLPAGTVDSLVADKPKLTGILKYHVVQGKYTAADLAKMDSVKTLDGKTLMITKKNGGIMVNGAMVVKPDVMASNGVIHAIDGVMMPK